MVTIIKKEFDTIEHFRSLQQTIADQLANMTFYQKKEYLKSVVEGKVELIDTDSRSIA